MKRVLIISYYWPPSGGSGVQRWVKFAKYLPSLGWQPVVYTPENPELTSVDKSLVGEIPREVEVIQRRITEPYDLYRKLFGSSATVDMKTILAQANDKGPVVHPADSGALPLDAKASEDEVTPINGQRKSFKQKLSLFIRGNFFIPDPRCWWIRPSVRYLKKYLCNHPCDVIISSGPPHSMHLIAQKVARKMNIPWIADFRDPWTKMYYLKYLELTGWAMRKHVRLEQSVLDNADVVLAVTEDVKADFASRTDTPVAMITNGFDEEDFEQVVEPDGMFNITHTGLFAADGNPLGLWKVLGEKCAQDAQFKKMLHLRLVGKNDKEVLASIKAQGLSANTMDLGYQNHQTAVREQMGASILILPLRNDPQYAPILPGKLFEYLASGRPVLGIGQEDGAMAKVLAQTDAGMMCDWSNLEGMRAFIDQSWERFKSDTLDSTTVNIEQYSRRNLTRRLADLMDSLIK